MYSSGTTLDEIERARKARSGSDSRPGGDDPQKRELAAAMMSGGAAPPSVSSVVQNSSDPDRKIANTSSIVVAATESLHVELARILDDQFKLGDRKALDSFAEERLGHWPSYVESIPKLRGAMISFDNLAVANLEVVVEVIVGFLPIYSKIHAEILAPRNPPALPKGLFDKLVQLNTDFNFFGVDQFEPLLKKMNSKDSRQWDLLEATVNLVVAHILSLAVSHFDGKNLLPDTISSLEKLAFHHFDHKKPRKVSAGNWARINAIIKDYWSQIIRDLSFTRPSEVVRELKHTIHSGSPSSNQIAGFILGTRFLQLNFEDADLAKQQDVLCNFIDAHLEVFSKFKNVSVQSAQLTVLLYALQQFDLRSLSKEQLRGEFVEKVTSLYTTVEKLSNNSDLKAGTYRLRTAIMLISWTEFYEEKMKSFFEKKVLKGLATDNKAMVCLECILSILRGIVIPMSSTDLIDDDGRRGSAPSIAEPRGSLSAVSSRASTASTASHSSSKLGLPDNVSERMRNKSMYGAVTRAGEQPSLVLKRLDMINKEVFPQKGSHRVQLFKDLCTEIVVYMAGQSLDFVVQNLFPLLLSTNHQLTAYHYVGLRAMRIILDKGSGFQQVTVSNPSNLNHEDVFVPQLKQLSVAIASDVQNILHSYEARAGPQVVGRNQNILPQLDFSSDGLSEIDSQLAVASESDDLVLTLFKEAVYCLPLLPIRSLLSGRDSFICPLLTHKHTSLAVTTTFTLQRLVKQAPEHRTNIVKSFLYCICSDLSLDHTSLATLFNHLASVINIWTRHMKDSGDGSEWIRSLPWDGLETALVIALCLPSGAHREATVAYFKSLSGLCEMLDEAPAKDTTVAPAANSLLSAPSSSRPNSIAPTLQISVISDESDAVVVATPRSSRSVSVMPKTCAPELVPLLTDSKDIVRRALYRCRLQAVNGVEKDMDWKMSTKVRFLTMMDVAVLDDHDLWTHCLTELGNLIVENELTRTPKIVRSQACSRPSPFHDVKALTMKSVVLSQGTQFTSRTWTNMQVLFLALFEGISPEAMTDMQQSDEVQYKTRKQELSELKSHMSEVWPFLTSPSHFLRQCVVTIACAAHYTTVHVVLESLFEWYMKQDKSRSDKKQQGHQHNVMPELAQLHRALTQTRKFPEAILLRPTTIAHFLRFLKEMEAEMGQQIPKPGFSVQPFYLDYALLCTHLASAMCRYINPCAPGLTRRETIPIGIEAWSGDDRTNTVQLLRRLSGHGQDATVVIDAEAAELSKLQNLKDFGHWDEKSKLFEQIHHCAHTAIIAIFRLGHLFLGDITWLINAERKGYSILHLELAYNFDKEFTYLLLNSYSIHESARDIEISFHALCDQFLRPTEDISGPGSGPGNSGSRDAVAVRRGDMSSREEQERPEEHPQVCEVAVKHVGELLHLCLFNLARQCSTIRSRAFDLLYAILPVFCAVQQVGLESDLSTVGPDQVRAAREKAKPLLDFLYEHKLSFKTDVIVKAQLIGIMVSERLSKLCPSLTEMLFKEAFSRFRTQDSTGKHYIAEFLLPWCDNVLLAHDNGTYSLKMFTLEAFLSEMYEMTREVADDNVREVKLMSLWERLAADVKPMADLDSTPNYNFPVIVDLIVNRAHRSAKDMAIAKSIALFLYLAQPRATIHLITKELTHARWKETYESTEKGTVRKKRRRPSHSVRRLQEQFKDYFHKRPTLLDLLEQRILEDKIVPIEEQTQLVLAGGDVNAPNKPPALKPPPPEGSPTSGRSKPPPPSSPPPGTPSSPPPEYEDPDSSMSAEGESSNGAASVLVNQAMKKSRPVPTLSRMATENSLLDKEKDETGDTAIVAVSILVDFIPESFTEFIPYIPTVLSYILIHLEPAGTRESDDVRKLLSEILSSLIVNEETIGITLSEQGKDAIKILCSYLEDPTFVVDWDADAESSLGSKALEPQSHLLALNQTVTWTPTDLMNAIISVFGHSKLVESLGEKLVQWAFRCSDYTLKFRALSLYRSLLIPLSPDVVHDLVSSFSWVLESTHAKRMQISLQQVNVVMVSAIEKLDQIGALGDYPAVFWVVVSLLRVRKHNAFKFGVSLLRQIMDSKCFREKLSRMQSGELPKEKELFMSYSNAWDPGFKGIQPMLFQGILLPDLEEDVISLLIDFYVLGWDELVDVYESRHLTTYLMIVPWISLVIDSESEKRTRTLQLVKRLALTFSAESHSFTPLREALLAIAAKQFKSEEVTEKVCSFLAEYYLPHCQSKILECLFFFLDQPKSKYFAVGMSMARHFLDSTHGATFLDEADAIVQIAKKNLLGEWPSACSRLLGAAVKVSEARGDRVLIGVKSKNEKRIAAAPVVPELTRIHSLGSDPGGELGLGDNFTAMTYVIQRSAKILNLLKDAQLA